MSLSGLSQAPRLLIIAGELSGDRYAQKLAIACKALIPALHIDGIGASHLSQASDTLVYNTQNNHAMGFWEQLKHIAQNNALLTTLDAHLSTHKVDHAILIDFQHMNTKIAAILAKHAIPITTFITPSFWIWNDQKGITAIASYSHQIVTIFKKEYDLYKPLNPNTYYFGHPIAQTHTPVHRDTTILSKRPATITLYPGSRTQEIHYHLPEMLKSARTLSTIDPTIQFKIVSIDPKLHPLITHYITKYPVPKLILETGFTDEILTTSTLVITVAGTSTLDLLLNHIPMISVGTVSYLTYLIGTYLFHISLPFAALPNIITGQAIVPDLTLKKVTQKNIVSHATQLLNPATATALIAQYPPIIQALSTGQNPIQETATLIAKALTLD
jgi:lipid-A-disaccharide synthase